jgi:hypothetical protein
LRSRGLPSSAKTRSILILDGYAALLRARRKHLRGWDDTTRGLYSRHRWLVEGAHGRAKTHHGLRRAVRRGLANVAIQSYLTAAAMNLKKLAAHTAPKRIYNALQILWKRIATPRPLVLAHAA